MTGVGGAGVLIKPQGAADPEFVAAGTAATATATDRITPSLPVGWAPGQRAVAVVAILDNVSPNNYAATGWVVEATSSGVANSIHCCFLTRTLQAGDGNPTCIYPGGGSNAHVAMIFTFANATQMVGTGWLYQKGSGDQFNSTPTAQSTTIPKSIMLSCGFVDFYQPLTLGTPQGFTQRGTVNLSGQGGFTFATKVIASPGSVTFPTYSGPQFSGLFFTHLGQELAA